MPVALTAVHRLILMLALPAIGLVGCANNDGDGGGTDDELIARAAAALDLQADDPSVVEPGHTYSYLPALAFVDLAGAREQLGLPADAALRPRRQRLLSTVATRPFFMFSTVFWPRPNVGGLSEVLDLRRVEAAVGTNFALSGPLSDSVGPEDVVVVRTRQPFEEIATALLKLGYGEGPDGLLVGGDPLPEPDGDVRWAFNYEGVPFPVAGETDTGLVVFGGSQRVVRESLADPDHELNDVAELVSSLPGVSRAARGFRPRYCVVAFGLGEDASPREGEAAIVVDGTAEAERFLFSATTQAATFFESDGGPEASEGEISFAEAVVEGDRATARFTSTDELNPARIGVEDAERPYECP